MKYLKCRIRDLKFKILGGFSRGRIVLKKGKGTPRKKRKLGKVRLKTWRTNQNGKPGMREDFRWGGFGGRKGKTKAA